MSRSVVRTTKPKCSAAAWTAARAAAVTSGPMPSPPITARSWVRIRGCSPGCGDPGWSGAALGLGARRVPLVLELFDRGLDVPAGELLRGGLVSGLDRVGDGAVLGDRPPSGLRLDQGDRREDLGGHLEDRGLGENEVVS